MLDSGGSNHAKGSDYLILMTGVLKMKKEILKIVPNSLSTSDNQQTVYLSAYWMEHLKLKENSMYTLICSINSLPVKIKKMPVKDISNNILWLSPDIFEKILIPEGITLEVIFTEKVIRIGPIIALLTENKFLKDYLNGTKCVEKYDLYADAAENASALIYVFSLRNLNSKDKYINGYIPKKDENNKWTWHKRLLPMPDAICNRMATAATSPAYERIKLIEEIVPNIKIVNRVTKISKWTIAEILQRDLVAKKYIPETHLLRGSGDIINMLEKYPVAYLKPVRRSLGLGIIKMEKNTEGNYTAYYNVNRFNLKINGDVNYILAELSEIMGKRRYIVQQGIPVALYRGEIFDLRVTIQKNGIGEWSFSRWSARVAGPGNIVSNVAAGGKGVPAKRILREIFGDRFQGIKDEVKKAGLIIAEALDRRLISIGDLGLDIGIDLNENIYLFEANFRAIRPSNINSKDKEAWRRTYHTSIYYLRYLYDVEIEKKYNPQL
ncbi:MAG: hypothetical protein K0R09_4 [Clostridiales bacterium]|nr:hypothetical protein [Clostridiales bacterium]